MAPEFLLLPLLAALAFAAFACASAWLAVQPVHAAALFLGVVVYNALDFQIAFKVGLQLYPADIVFLILAVAAAIRLCLFTTIKAVPGAWWIIGIVQLGLAVWGYKSIGTLAGVDARGHFYLWVTVLYFCSIKWNESMIVRVVNLWILCAVCLCLIAYYRWGRSALDPAYEQQIMALDTTGVRFRVIGSSATLVIAISTLALLFRMIKGTLAPALWVLVPVQLITIAVLQHRSVWVSLLVGALCLLLARPGKRKPLRALTAVASLVLPLALVLSLPGGDNTVVQSVKSSADHAVSTEEGTMVGRTIFWDKLVSQWTGSGDLRTYLVGFPYGSGYYLLELEDGTRQDMVPHNHFLHLLYRGGLVGLLATLFIFLKTWKAALKQTKQADRPSAHFLFAVLTALFAYFIPYWATPESGLPLGLAIGYLGADRRARVSISHVTRIARFAPHRMPAPFRAAVRYQFRPRLSHQQGAQR